MSRTEAAGQSERAPRRARRQLVLAGAAVAPGIGIGPIAVAEEPRLPKVRRKIAASDTGVELQLLDEAVTRARRQLQKLRNRLTGLPEESRSEIAPLIDAHLMMLGNSRLMRAIRADISERLMSAATAVIEASDAQAEAILARRRTDAGTESGSEAGTGAGNAADEFAGAERQAEEIREIGRRLLRNLVRLPFRSFSTLDEGSILISDALRPADVALIDPSRFAGVAAEEGSADGHTAIMLRALGVPAVLGIPGLIAAAKPGTTAILDGSAGTVTLNVGRRTLADAERSRSAFYRSQRGLARLKRLASETSDHVAIDLQGNLELPFELPMLAQSGAAGIGLMRTEFLFMSQDSLPDEDMQFAVYRNTVEAMDGDPVTIRLLDWGSDKEIEALTVAGLVPDTQEANPALGMRGIRMLLQNQPLLDTQVAAILRAATYGKVRLLIPMVSRLSEIEAVRDTIDRAWRRLRRRRVRLPETPPPIGIMVETPAAVMLARRFSKLCDFFAIGTNDLTMYALAADRGLPPRLGLYDTLDPAILGLIEMTVAAAATARIPVSLCGEIAGRPEAIPLLVGLGLRQLSMHGGAVLRAKQTVRSVSVEACAALARETMEAADSDSVHALLAAFAENRTGKG